MLQPRDRVRAFLIRYQDRVLYGTDLEFRPGEDPLGAISRWENEYTRDWKYFATNQTLVYKNRIVRGLGCRNRCCASCITRTR
jgi:hypothetical protein